MSKRRVMNVAASVGQRLRIAARSSGRPYQELLQYYAMERFLYRLAQSPHADRFVLKGALMFNAWRAPTPRPTKDIDLLGHIENSPVALAAAIRDICRQAVAPDGLVFDPKSVVAAVIKEGADYEGVRVTFRGSLENARLAMQVDVGFGDVAYPSPEAVDYPTILDHAAPQVRGYARETAVAEKFEAMVKLGRLNSRLKDFYDIWLLSQQFDFDGATLVTAIEKTFARRATTVTARATALAPAFASDSTKARQWKAFVSKSRLGDAPAELAVVVGAVAEFLAPPAEALSSGGSFRHFWRAPGPWTP